MSEHHEAGRDPSQASASAEHGPEESRRGSFLGFVAHEMRNPLSTALWSAELLARLSPQERAGQRGEKLSGMCLRSLQRLRVLVEDHFLAERLAVGGIPIRLEPVPLREMIEAAVARLDLPDSSLQLDEDAVAWADRGFLERAVEGLLAVAGRGKAPLRVEAAREAGAAVLRVRGAQPAPDALEPPQKGTASDPTGRALSLHTAVQVARALGGLLSIAGEDYVLSLPLAPAGAGAGAL